MRGLPQDLIFSGPYFKGKNNWDKDCWVNLSRWMMDDDK